jgi:polygalacturonase
MQSVHGAPTDGSVRRVGARARRKPVWLSILETGAVRDAREPSTAALQRAIDQCAKAGGGTVLVPAGRYMTGTIWMRSNITLHLEAGAVLQGIPDLTAFPVWTSRWEGGAQPVHAAMIAGEGLHDIAITGRGTLDGCGRFWWDLFAKEQLKHTRPGLVNFVDCRNVLIEGITCINSPRWTLMPTACDIVTIRGVNIRNPADSPNTDGINPDSCSNVHISDCHIDVGDDCITLKSGSEQDGRARHAACQNITITNCTMLHGHGGVVVGSEMSGGVRNVAISNCVFSGTDRGIRLKSRRGRGNVVEDIRVDNLVMDNVLCPIALNLFYGCDVSDASLVTDMSPRPVDAGTPCFRRLRFNNISAQRVKWAAVYVLGLPEMLVDDVTFDGLSFYLDRQNTQSGAPVMAPGIPEVCRAGIMIRNAHNVKLRRIDLHDQLGPVVTIENSADILVGDLSAKRDGNSPLVVLDGHNADADASATNGRDRTFLPPSTKVFTSAAQHEATHHNGDAIDVLATLNGDAATKRS